MPRVKMADLEAKQQILTDTLGCPHFVERGPEEAGAKYAIIRVMDGKRKVVSPYVPAAWLLDLADMYLEGWFLGRGVNT